jgi:hypothetical protein
MVTYPGCFSGHLICRPDPEINYTAFQTVAVSVRQHNQILTTKLIEKIDVIGQFFELPFNYIKTTGTVQLLVETQCANDQFNKDNPIELAQLTVDDLFTIPHLVMLGKLMYNDQLLDIGNVLWQSGQLIYTFNLPIINTVKIIKGSTR